jgi:hypothetical protein
MNEEVSRRRMLLRVGAAFVVVAAAIFSVSIYQRTQDHCSDTPIAESMSPDGKYKAIVLARAFGTANGMSTKVAVVGANAANTESLGTAVIVDTNSGASPAGLGGGPTVGTTWVSESELRLTYHSNAKVWKAATSVGPIRITHVRNAADA